MPLINVNQIDVEFPFEPYSCQVAYMEKIIDCLKGRHNGILESPTGTGKTLNLLCSSLAWLQHEKDNNMSRMLPMTTNPGIANGSNAFDMVGHRSQIIYTSRTHSQLLQAMRELKRTAYAPRFRAVALGARDHLCLNSSVMKEPNSAVRINLCKAKVNARICHFHTNIDKAEAAVKMESCLDIEDLMKLGTKHSFCPYYMSKKLTPEYDIIFMPYNYVLTKSMRKANNIDLKNAVVIFDEAHNVHRVCEDSSSIEITSSEIALAIDELTQVGNLITKSDKPDAEEQQDDAIWNPTAGKKNSNKDDESKITITLPEAMEMKKALLDLENAIDNIPLDEKSSRGNDKNGRQKSFDGKDIYDVFHEAGIGFSNSPRYISILTSSVEYLNKDATNLNQSVLFRSRGSALSHISDCLQVIFASDFDNKVQMSKEEEARLENENSKEFKMHVAEIEAKSKNPSNEPMTWDATPVQKSQVKGRRLSYWCLSASHAMRDLPALGVRSVILTSGTLSPLKSLAAELGLPFEVTFQNKHVITSKQCRVAIINKGPDGTELKSTYQCRDDPLYMRSLGMLLVNLSRRVTGGILVFFPSYTLLDTCVNMWQRPSQTGQTPVFKTLNDVRKVIVEPRGKTQFSQTYDEYDKVIKERGGAILMAVCRGKASEGIDFSDYQSRLVVIVGLPYPPIFDPRVVLKMAYLDDLNRKGTRLVNGEKMSLSGREWYEQEAMRAVNQAIGRVIRHRWDYGFVVLADSRFGNPGVRSQLPLWLQTSLVPYGDKVGKLLSDMSEFYRLAMLEIDSDPLAQRLLELTKSNNTIAASSQIGDSFSQRPSGSAFESHAKRPRVVGSSQSSLPCSQKSNACSAASLMAIYGKQPEKAEETLENDESVFSCLENCKGQQSSQVITKISQPKQIGVSPSPSGQTSQRKRKFSVMSPPGTKEPLKAADNESDDADKEKRIRQMAATIPADKREKLFRPFLTYRKTQGETNSINNLLIELSGSNFALMLKSFPKELTVLSDVIHPLHKEKYNNFLTANNVRI